MIQFQDVSIAYKKYPVLNHVNVTIQDNEFFVLVGSSGCGKTTFLKSINKLLQIKSGSITIDGTSVDDIRIQQLPKLVGYVVQSGGLFPHLTVEENISLTMEIGGYPKKDIHDRVLEMLQMVSLDPEIYRRKYPSQLSGGQQQRVGVARAFAMNPPIVLMDEPFSALDPVTRGELQKDIHQLQRKTKKTVVFVTHDMDEAIKLADRICVIQGGEIVQCDTPEVILKHPANEYVEEFIGKTRLWSAPSLIRAEDIMRSEPLYVQPDCTVAKAVEKMREAGIDNLLVTDENRVYRGVVWLRDLTEKHVSAEDTVGAQIKDNTPTLSVSDSLTDILSFVKEKEKRDFVILPVLDEAGVLKGFVNKNSLLFTLSRRYHDSACK